MNQIIKYLLSIVTNIVILLCICVSAAFARQAVTNHHVEVESATSETKETKETKPHTDKIINSKKVTQAEKSNQIQNTKSNRNSDTKKIDNDKNSLTQDTAIKISKKLPGYFKEWLSCENNCNKQKLTYSEILTLIEKSNITEQQAAVLAAIVTYINGLNAPQDAKFSLAELQKLFTTNTGYIYTSYYKTALTNLNNEKSLPEKDKLFGRTKEANGQWYSGITKNTLIIQNGLGDCFTLSSINGILNHPDGPKKLEDMITPIPGHKNEYWVNFPGYSWPIFVYLTPTKLAMYSELKNGGEWLAIMSDAVARARRDNPESGIFNGGYQTFILHLLTGKSYRNEALSPFTKPQSELLKSMNDTQYYALENILTGSNDKQLLAELQSLGSLSSAQLKADLTKEQYEEFKKLTTAQLATLESLTTAQWNEVYTLIYNNKGNLNLKLLDRSLKANRTEEDYSDQLDTLLNVDKPPKIVGIETNVHDLTVLAYDKSTGMLTIKNPWGDTGWYNPVTGDGPNNAMPKKGTSPPWYDMNNGVFNAMLSQLVASGFVTITIPITHSVDETKKLVNDAKNATQSGGQVSTMQTQIAQAQAVMKETKDERHAAELSASLKEANAVLANLISTCQRCQAHDDKETACQQDLATAEEEANAAMDKLKNTIKLF